jgi:hypothetical protein
MSLIGEFSGRMTKSGESLSAAEQEQVANAKLRATARENFSELDLRPVRGGLYADQRGDLFEPIPGMVVTSSGQLLVDRRDVAGFFLGDDLADHVPVFVRRVAKGPTTLDELQAEKAEQRKRRQQAVEAEANRVAKLPRSAVTYAELHNLSNAPSLRRAAEIVEAAAGEFELTGGELVITLPA